MEYWSRMKSLMNNIWSVKYLIFVNIRSCKVKNKWKYYISYRNFKTAFTKLTKRYIRNSTLQCKSYYAQTMHFKNQILKMKLSDVIETEWKTQKERKVEMQRNEMVAINGALFGNNRLIRCHNTICPPSRIPLAVMWPQRCFFFRQMSGWF